MHNLEFLFNKYVQNLFHLTHTHTHTHTQSPPSGPSHFWPPSPKQRWSLSVCVFSCSAMSHSLPPHGLYPTRLLCPWDVPDKNTAVRCHFLLQGIFPTRGLNCISCICKWIPYHLSHLGSTFPLFSFCYFLQRHNIHLIIFKKNTYNLLCFLLSSTILQALCFLFLWLIKPEPDSVLIKHCLCKETLGR